jgi:hypothetical protein
VRHFESRFPTWVTVPVGHQATWQGGRSYLEILTKDDVAHFRRSEGGGKFFNIAKTDHAGRSWFSVDRVIAHDGPKPPEDELQLPRLLAGGEVGVAESPQTIAARWAALTSAPRRWLSRTASRKPSMSPACAAVNCGTQAGAGCWLPGLDCIWLLSVRGPVWLPA